MKCRRRKGKCFHLWKATDSWCVMLLLIIFLWTSQWPLTLHTLISSVFCFPAFPSWGFICQDSSWLPGSRSFLLIHPPLLDVSMPVEPWFLAAKAKSISLSVRCLCSNILQTPPAKIFMLYSWVMLRERQARTRRDTAVSLLGSKLEHCAAHITVACDLYFVQFLLNIAESV